MTGTDALGPVMPALLKAARAESRRLREDARRLPVDPLLRAAGARNLRELADMAGVTHRAARRWSSQGLPWWNADRVACRLDLHPINVWPDFYELVGLAA